MEIRVHMHRSPSLRSFKQLTNAPRLEKRERILRDRPTRHRVEATFNIRQLNSGYEVQISADHPKPFRQIRLSPHDLSSLNLEVQRELGSITRMRTSRDWKDASSDELNGLLHEITKIGHYAFCRIFSDPQLQMEVRDLLERAPNLVLSIVSDPSFAAPWELLCPEKPAKSVTLNSLWGMKHIIKRLLPRSGPFFPNADIEYIDRARFCLVSSADLAHVRSREVPFLEEAEAGGKIDLFHLRPLRSSLRSEDLEYFGNYLNREYHLVHFACHAFYDTESPMRSFFNVSDDFHITFSDMTGIELRFCDTGPLIFLNACETGNLNPLYTSSFVDTILNAGARGVIATECPIPDEFAAEFAEDLLSRLLKGQSLGASLLETRRYFWEEHHNPTGLLYSLYADPSTRLKRLNWRVTYA